jgi:hypothetical protein
MLSLLESFKKFFTYNHSSPVTPVIKEKDKMIEITKTYLEGLSDTKVMASGPGDNVKLFTIPSHIVLKDIDETLCVENTQTKQCLECYLSSFTVCDEVCSNKLILESISKGEFENVVVEPVVEVAEPLVEPLVESLVEPLVEPLVESLVEPLVEPVVEQLVEHVVEVAKPEDIIENLVHEILFDIPKVELPFEKYVPFPPYDSECPTPDNELANDLLVDESYGFIDSESPGPTETSEFD